MKNISFEKTVTVSAAAATGRANDPLALEAGEASAPASDPARRRQRFGTAPGRAGRRTPDSAPVDSRLTLQAMPAELLHKIADYLAPDSGASRALTLTSRKLRLQFCERVRSDGLQVRAQRGPGQDETIDFYTKLIAQVDSLPEPQRCKVLYAIGRHAGAYLRPGDAAPLPLLEGLMKGMLEARNPMRRYAVMHALGAMVADARFKWSMKESYDPALQGLSTTALAEHREIADFRNPFPEPFLADFFNLFNRESTAFIGKYGASIAATHSRTAQSASAVTGAPFAAPATVAMVQAQTMGMLVRGAYLVLPFEARPQQWRAQYQRAETTEPGARLVLLLALSDALIDLHAPQERIDAFHAVRGSASQLKPEPRAQLLNKLATILQDIDAGEQAPFLRQAVLLSSADLPQAAHFECIALMTASLGTLEQEARVPAFADMLAAVESGTSAAAGKLVSALAGEIVKLPAEACSAMFDALLAVAGKLNASEQAACHVSLAEALEPFYDYPWLEGSLVALHAAVARRSSATRGLVAAALACQLEKFNSAAVRGAILSGALAYLQRRSVDERLPLLAKITGAPFRRGGQDDRRAALESVLDLLDGMQPKDGALLVLELISGLQKSGCKDFEKAKLLNRLTISFTELRPEEHITLCRPAMHLAAALTYPLNKQCASALLACGQTLPSRHVDAAMRALSVGLMEVVEQFVDPAQQMTEQQQKRLDDFLLLAPILPEAMQTSLVRKLDKFIDQLPLLDFATGRDKLLAYFKTCSPELNQRIYAGHLASNP